MDTQQFGKFIVEQRKAKGYTQKELAIWVRMIVLTSPSINFIILIPLKVWRNYDETVYGFRKSA